MNRLQDAYAAEKAKHPGKVLFYRFGDFYEVLGDDAYHVADILGLAVARRGDTPMCGVPAWRITDFLRELTDRGHNVALHPEMAS